MDSGKQQDYKVQRQKLVQNIRRQNREQQFNKRRNVSKQGNLLEVQQQAGNAASSIKTSKPLIVDQQRRQAIEEIINQKYFPHMFPSLVALLYSQDIIDKHKAIIGIRKTLSISDTPPIFLVFQHNILPIIIQYMEQQIYPHLRLQATWIISNIATGSPQNVHALVQNNVVPILVKLLLENQKGVIDQAIWAIGNLAGDSPAVRDNIIAEKGVDAVIHFINNTTIRNNLVTAVWALSNLCRGTPLPQYVKIQKAIPVLCKIVTLRVLDDQNLSDCLWAIHYGTQGPKIRLNNLIQANAAGIVIQLTKSFLMSIATPALRILGNISTGSQQQTQVLLDNNILQIFQQLLQHKKALIRRQSCWIISNIAAGTRTQIDQLLDRNVLINKLLTLFELDSHQVRREICYIFANMVFLGEKQRVRKLIVQKQVTRFYGQCLLQRDNIKLIQTCLDTLPMLFQFGQTFKAQSQYGNNFIVDMFLSYPGVTEGFEQLQHLDSQKIYQKTHKIYEKYLDPERNQGEDGTKMMIQI